MTADRKRAEEILQKHKGKNQFYIGSVPVVSNDVAIDAMLEFASLPVVTDEEIYLHIKELRQNILCPPGNNMGTGRITLGEVEWINVCLDTAQWMRYRLQPSVEEKKESSGNSENK